MMKIYLSPSIQRENTYPNEGDEQYWMKQIADAMTPCLRAGGMEVICRGPNTDENAAIRESNSVHCGLYLALYSNTAPPELSGKLKGTDARYYQYSKNGRRAAEIFVQNLKRIYPEPGLVKAVPTAGLAELTKTEAPAVLVEIAYHDNPQDEAWLVNNVEQIAKNLARSAAEYLGVSLGDA